MGNIFSIFHRSNNSTVHSNDAVICDQITPNSNNSVVVDDKIKVFRDGGLGNYKKINAENERKQKDCGRDKPNIVQIDSVVDECLSSAVNDALRKQTNSFASIRWKKGERIGRGAYGTVYLGLNNNTGELMAIKQVSTIISKQNVNTIGTADQHARKHLKALQNEINTMRSLSHPNIVRYKGTVRDKNYLYIFMEFVPGGSIASILSRFGKLNESLVRHYMKQILQGLSYLHGHYIVHGDIKGANILVDHGGNIKLADFGASKKKRIEIISSTNNKNTVAEKYHDDVVVVGMEEPPSMQGTSYWMAPEVINLSKFGLKSDIWSLGCVFIEMISGKPPWSEYKTQVTALYHIGMTATAPPLAESISSGAREFMNACLQIDPENRLSADQLLKLSFFDDAIDADIGDVVDSSGSGSIDSMKSMNDHGAFKHNEEYTIREQECAKYNNNNNNNNDNNDNTINQNHSNHSNNNTIINSNKMISNRSHRNIGRRPLVKDIFPSEDTTKSPIRTILSVSNRSKNNEKHSKIEERKQEERAKNDRSMKKHHSISPQYPHDDNMDNNNSILSNDNNSTSAINATNQTTTSSDNTMKNPKRKIMSRKKKIVANKSRHLSRSILPMDSM